MKCLRIVSAFFVLAAAACGGDGITAPSARPAARPLMDGGLGGMGGGGRSSTLCSVDCTLAQ